MCIRLVGLTSRFTKTNRSCHRFYITIYLHAIGKQCEIFAICTKRNFLFSVSQLSYGLGKVLFPHNTDMQLGMFFTGAAPGGGASNMWTAILNANLSLSIIMTTISNIAAFAMMPLWLFTLGKEIFDKSEIPVPYTQISTYVAALVVPLFIGYLIQKYCTRIARFMARILKAASGILLLFIIIFAIVTNLYLFELFSWQVSQTFFSKKASSFDISLDYSIRTRITMVRLCFGLDICQTLQAIIKRRFNNSDRGRNTKHWHIHISLARCSTTTRS